VIRSADTEHLTAELKWLGDVLGRARDAEVLAAHLRAQQEQTDAAGLLGPVARRVDSYFAEAAATAGTAALRALNSRRYTALLDGLDAIVTEPPLGPDGDAAAGPALAAAVARSYRATRRRMHRALASPQGQDRDVALHQARKAAKRARYAAEAAVPVAGKDASRFAGQMKQLQTVLGDHQDTVIAREVERRLGIAAHRAGENAFSYGLFYERDACEARQLQDLAGQVWRTASRPRYRHWLASAA
jgi:CHAD domain-containing protein